MNIKKTIAVMVASAIIAGAGLAVPFNGQASAATSTGQRVINAGLKYLGTPYEYGSSRYNTRTFDCSDFTRQAFKVGARITIPSDSRSQAAHVKRIGDTHTNWRYLSKGDLMFFMSYKGTKKSSYSRLNKSKQRITHVGIYMGNGKVLHTYGQGGVKISKIAGTHWENRYIFGGRAVR